VTSISRKKGDARPVILILAHARKEKLEQTLRALALANITHRHRIIACVDGDDPGVLEALGRGIDPEFLLQSRSLGNLPVSSRIRSSLRTGLSLGFSTLGAPYVTVIEDDIVVAPDFLDFVSASHMQFGSTRRYRGVNGFSRVSDLPGPALEKKRLVAKLNFGLGWGWSITAQIYARIEPYLSQEQTSEDHWDGLIETYVRSGFVINPIVSRIKNLGFDASASHTSGQDSKKIGAEISKSFEANFSPTGKPIADLRIVSTPFPWRFDCVNLATMNSIQRTVYYFALSTTSKVKRYKSSRNTKISRLAKLLSDRLYSNLINRYFFVHRHNGL